MSFSDLFSTRVCNSLQRESILTIHDLMNTQITKLKMFRGVGDVSLKEIINVLKKYNITLSY